MKLTPLLVLALLVVSTAHAGRSLSVAPVTARIDRWGPAFPPGPPGNCIRPQLLIRLENVTSIPQDVTVTMDWEDVRSDAFPTITERRAAISRTTANRTASGSLPANGHAELGFTSACGLLTTSNTIDCLTYVQTQISPVCDATRLFTLDGGRFFYTAKLTVDVQQDRGAIVASLLNSVQVSGWGGDTQWSTVVQQVNGGRAF